MTHRALLAVFTCLATCVPLQAIAREVPGVEHGPFLAQNSGSEPPGSSDRTNPARPQPSTGVRNLQSRLAQLGYYDGPIDGMANEAMRGAIVAFQEDVGLVGTGILDPLTQQRLADPDAAQTNPDDGGNASSLPGLPDSGDANRGPERSDGSTSSDPIIEPDSDSSPFFETDSAPSAAADGGDAAEPSPVGSSPQSSDAPEPDGVDLTPAAEESVEEAIADDRGRSRLVVLVLMVLAVAGLGTAAILWLARRGTERDQDSDGPFDGSGESISAPASSSQAPAVSTQNGHTLSSHSPDSDRTPLSSFSIEPAAEHRVAKINIVEELVGDLSSPDPELRRKAIWELGQRGNSAAVPPLVGLLPGADSHEQSLVLAALSEISMKTLKPMNRAVALALQDDNPEVRKNAIRDLARVYDSMGQFGRMLSYASTDSDPEVRQTATWALNQLNRMQLSASEPISLLQEGRDGETTAEGSESSHSS